MLHCCTISDCTTYRHTVLSHTFITPYVHHHITVYSTISTLHYSTPSHPMCSTTSQYTVHTILLHYNTSSFSTSHYTVQHHSQHTIPSAHCRAIHHTPTHHHHATLMLTTSQHTVPYTLFTTTHHTLTHHHIILCSTIHSIQYHSIISTLHYNRINFSTPSSHHTVQHQFTLHKSITTWLQHTTFQHTILRLQCHSHLAHITVCLCILHHKIMIAAQCVLHVVSNRRE